MWARMWGSVVIFRRQKVSASKTVWRNNDLYSIIFFVFSLFVIYSWCEGQCAVMFTWLLFKITFNILYEQVCASERRITMQQLLADVGVCVKMVHKNWHRTVSYSLLKYRIFSNLIRTSFCRFLKRKKKKLVRGSNPHLSFNRLQRSRVGCRLHGKPSRRALSSDLSRSVA